MPSSDFFFQAVVTVAFSLPLIAALWKVFSAIAEMREKFKDALEAIDDRLTEVQHQQQVKSVQFEAINDKVVLSINGIEEMVKHVRTRTTNEHEKLRNRVEQMESFLAKTTPFEPRR